MVWVNNLFYKSLYEFNNDAILTISHDDTMVDVNQSACKLFKIDISHILGSNFNRFIDENYRDVLKKMIQSMQQGKIKEEVIRLAKDLENEISFLAKFIPVEPNDPTKGMFLILKEISLYDTLSDKVFDSETNFQIIAENIQDVIILMNEKKEYLYISPASKKVYNYDPSCYSKGDEPFFNIHPDDVDLINEQFQKSIETRQPFKVVIRGLHLEKGWIWTELSGTPVFDKDSNFSRMVLVARDISLQKEKEDRLQFLAYHDYLTGLPNRRMLYEKLDEAIERLNTQNQPFIILMLDLDDFKVINDQLGHEYGDKVIIEFGKRISEAIGDEGIAARLGGDEFIVLVNHYSTEEELLQFIQRLQARITEKYILDNVHSILLSSSIGVMICNQKYMDRTYYIKSADEALYNVKYEGKNKYFIKSV